MNEIIIQLFYFTASYFGVTIIIIWLLNWMTKGFLLTYFKVKKGRGKNILAIIHSKTDTYYRSAAFDKYGLRYKNREGEWARFPEVNRDSIYSMLGVYCLEIDESTKKILDRLKSEASEQNPVEIDNTIRQAIDSPRIESNKDKILLAAVVMTLAAVAVVAMMVYNQGEAIAQIQQISGII